MATSTLLLLSLLVLASASSLKSKSPRKFETQFTYDRSSDLIGQTVYFDYQYYDDRFITPKDLGFPHYTGYISDFDPKDQMFDADEKARIHVLDCGDGYVCLESVYNGYYLGLADFDRTVNFYDTRGDDAVLQNYKFKIFCDRKTGLYSYDNCEIVGLDEDDDEVRIFGTYLNFLQYCDDCGDDDWFPFTIVSVRPLDKYGVVLESECNRGSGNKKAYFEVAVGAVFDNEHTHFEFDGQVTKELQRNLDYAYLHRQLNHMELWPSVASTSYEPLVLHREEFTLRPNERAVLKQLAVEYAVLNVYTDLYKIEIQRC